MGQHAAGLHLELYPLLAQQAFPSLKLLGVLGLSTINILTIICGNNKENHQIIMKGIFECVYEYIHNNQTRLEVYKEKKLNKM